MPTQKNGRVGAAGKEMHAHFTRFRRERLPMPIRYFTERGIKLLGGGEWRTLRCPFHPDKSPSLRIHLIDGRWRCMACGVHGGDMLEFHRKLHALTFKQACIDLGCWDDRP